MQLPSIVTLLVAALSATAAAAPASDATSKAPRFHLKTRVVNGGGNAQYDGLYVFPLHAGAALNSVALTAEKKFVHPSYIKDKSVYFDLGNGPDSQYSLQFDQRDLYEGWAYTNIIPGKGYNGISINKKGELDHALARLLRKNGLPPWRVCLWNHGQPELFYNNAYSSDSSNEHVIPSSCALVELDVEYI